MTPDDRPLRSRAAPVDREVAFRCRRDRGGYQAEVIRQGAKLTPGTITVAEVWHDADCRRPQGEPCTCEPVTRLRPLDDPSRN